MLIKYIATPIRTLSINTPKMFNIVFGLEIKSNERFNENTEHTITNSILIIFNIYFTITLYILFKVPTSFLFYTNQFQTQN